MAVKPLFISDMSTLKARLRLTGATQNDALAMLDAAVQKARALLYKQLGATQIVLILSTPYDDNPTTDEGAQRLMANAVELMIVKLDLLRSLPILFMDSSGAKREVWNEEGFSRRLDERYIRDETSRLENDIAAALDALMPEEDDESAGRVRASTIGPLCTPAAPGASVFGGSF